MHLLVKGMHSRCEQAKVYTAGTKVQCQANKLIGQEAEYQFWAVGQTERRCIYYHLWGPMRNAVHLQRVDTAA